MYEEKTKMLENSSRFLIGEFIFFIGFTIIMASGQLTLTLTGDGDLGITILFGLSFYSTLFFIPGLISGICGLRYCSVKKIIALILCWIFGIIFLIENLVICTIMIINEVWFVLFLYLLILTLPNILFLIGCYKATKEYWLIHYSI